MTASPPPKVSIGLPVYNGENYLEEAIVALRGQTYRDFELILSDNASTDRTEEIGRRHAALDPRIRYLRLEENVGAARNFNRTVELATGEYFKWAAHDDLCRPAFLERCVELLDCNPEAVLAYARYVTIDDDGTVVNERPAQPEWGAREPRRRFRECLAEGEPIAVFGLMRREALAGTPLIGGYAASDRPLLARLALEGRFLEVPEFLFCHRQHRQRSVKVYNCGDPHQAVAWYAPERQGELQFPEWRLLAEFEAAIRDSPVPARERLACRRELLRWARRHRRAMGRDLAMAVGHLPVVGPSWTRWREASKSRDYERDVRRVRAKIERLIPDGDAFVLVDHAKLGIERCGNRAVLPFLERDGRYWGPPPSDAIAMEELERMRRQRRARFLVFGWPAHWWLDYYTDFRRYLEANFPCLLKSDRLVVFDMRDDSSP